MARFRLFGRGPAGPPPPYPAPAYTRAAGPLSASARPSGRGVAPTDDPPTDPVGFAPIRTADPAGVGPPGGDPRGAGTWDGWTGSASGSRGAVPGVGGPGVGGPGVGGVLGAGAPGRGVPPAGASGAGSAAGRGPVPSAAPPHPAEAAALAGAFAVDYLSWDEDDPERRGRVLLDYLPAPGSDPARLGWSGEGRQRAEFALPGLVRPDGEGRVLVDVRVRVTPYRAVGEHGPDPASAAAEPDVAGIPAVAPAPTGRGWRSLASAWIRISVPVAVEGGRLVVDAWEETLGEEPPAAAGPAVAPDDVSVADDDPLTAPSGAAETAGSDW